MATITVTSNADSGAGSLREAITNAQSGDTIKFDASLANQTITLTSGQIEIAPGKELIIDGIDAENLAISGNNSSRIFHLDSNVDFISNLTLKNLTLTEGYHAENGGAILTEHLATLNIENVDFNNNVADLGGGAIYVSWEGTLTVTDSTFDGNEAIAGNDERGAGAITFLSPNEITIINSDFTNNRGINGGAINSLNGKLTIENSRFINNDTTSGFYDTGNPRPFLRGFGGAVYTDRASTASDDTSGTISITNSLFSGNSGRGEGGAAYLYTGRQDNVVISDTLFEDNQVLALEGGGALGSGGAVVQQSDGLNQGFTLNNSTFANNTAGNQGGGLWVQNAPTTISNSTFSGNQTLDQIPSSVGGAITVYSPTNITNTTIANNHAGWVAGGLAANDSEVTIQDSIFYNNTADNGPNDWGIQQHSNREFTDLGGNFQYPPKATNNFNDYNVTATIETTVDPQLESLQDNGGSVPTHGVGNPVAANSGVIVTQEPPVDENLTDETPVDETPTDENHADENPTDENPTDENPTDENPTDETPTDETPTDETPIEDENPVDETPVDETPVDETPADENPTDETPIEDENPVDETPADENPVDETPVDETPVDENPVDETPVDETPIDENPVDETPVDETPVDETPVDETPVDETPVDETPVDETPVDETPVDETPVDETPVDETPVDETPVDETPVDETPTDETPVEENDFELVAPYLNHLDDNSFTIASQESVQLNFQLLNNNSEQIYEIGVFVVEDDQGSVDGLTPDDESYLQTALSHSQTQIIFSTLFNQPNGFDVERSRIIEGLSSDRLVVYLVQGGSTGEVLSGQISEDRVILGSTFTDNPSSSLQVEESEDGAYVLSWFDQNSTSESDLPEVVLSLEITTETTPIGTALQGQPERELIDLRSETQQRTANFSVQREAAYDSVTGLYRVDDELGTVDGITPGEEGYAQAALARRVDNLELSVENGGTQTTSAILDEGVILAPYIIADGDVNEFLQQNPDNSSGEDILAYFVYQGANPDGEDHIRLLGDNTFGFEDTFEGGDGDFNDLVLEVSF